MNFRALRIPLLLALAAASLAASFADEYLLQWRPKKDQELRYTLSIESTIEGAKVELGGDMLLEVMAVEKNGDYTVRSTYSNPRFVIDGEKQEIPDESPSKPLTEKFNAKGEKIGGDEPDDEEGEDIAPRSLTLLLDFVGPEKPMKVGDAWSHDFKADPKQASSRPAKADYKVIGIEKSGKFDVVRVSVTFKEVEGDKPMSAEGHFLIDVSDGAMVKTEMKVENLKFDEEPISGASRVTVDRK